jgi:transcription termination/antitermination protein NusA
MVKLSHVIEELVEEKGLDRSILINVVCEGMLAAYKKKYPDLNLTITYNKKTDEIEISIEKTVVASATDVEHELSLRKARSVKEDIQVGDKLWIPFEGPIGRIEILKAKQFIAQKIRSIEASAVYKEFKPKEGTIVYGTVYKCEYNGAIIKLQETLAFLPRSLMIPAEKCIPGYSIRALLKEVYEEPRNENQLILDRVSPEFLKKLFELEFPEVYEKLVEIKKIVRAPGYKSKVLVVSNDKDIDPVGTCVGIKGARINPLIKELGGIEKIDVIGLSDSVENFVKNALKPAHINRVEVIDNKNANVWLDEDQRSLAIGKMGQNISLACQLTGLNIHLMKNEELDEQADEVVIE